MPDAPASLGDDAVALLQRLIAFNTVNPPGNELEAQTYLKEQLGSAGFECELAGEVRERPNLIARLKGDAPGKVLCFLSHVDTVLADPSEWTVDPWSGELRDGHVWGRGALDMKSQVASEVAAACALGRAGWRPPAGDLLVVVTCDEEAGATLGAKWLCEQVPDKVRCDWVVNEGAGELVEFGGRRFYSLCLGEKGVFRFKLRTSGRAGHASIPKIGDNALMKMAEILARLDGHQPPLDPTTEGAAALAALLEGPTDDPAAALSEVLAAEPRFAYLLEPMMGVTLAPTMIRASEKENVIPSSCSVVVDCRVPPGLGGEHVTRRVEELIGPANDTTYSMRFIDEIVGNSSPLDTPLADACIEFVRAHDPDAQVLPVVLPGFTDSHWFRKAFPECVAYGFYPQRAMTLFDTMPLVHAPDERISTDDVKLATEFFYALPSYMLV